MGKKKINKYMFPQGDQLTQIRNSFQELGFEASAHSFEFLIEKVIEENGTHFDLLEQLLKHEYTVREDGRKSRWLQKSKMSEVRDVKQYPYKLQPSVDPVLINELATCRFIDEGKNILLLGNAGVGKTTLALGLGNAAIQSGYEVRFMTHNEFDVAVSRAADSSLKRLHQSLMIPRLLILDDVDCFDTSEESRRFLHNVIKQRFEEGKPIIITSNKDPEQWGVIFGDEKQHKTIIDRLLHHEKRVVIVIDGPSLRVPGPVTPTTIKSLRSPIEGSWESTRILKKISAVFAQKSD